MALYRKKPVVIEAWRYPFRSDPETGEMYPLKFMAAVCVPTREPYCVHKEGCVGPGPHIHTLEGAMFIKDGDWIIQGVGGEFYPCKPDIFEKTYEPVL